MEWIDQRGLHRGVVTDCLTGLERLDFVNKWSLTEDMELRDAEKSAESLFEAQSVVQIREVRLFRRLTLQQR